VLPSKPPLIAAESGISTVIFATEFAAGVTARV
jgi:hypothetical protein